MLLRANNNEALDLFGIATTGVVLSTLREAADADYPLVVMKTAAPQGIKYVSS
jgi:nicotinamidase-related amidase